MSKAHVAKLRDIAMSIAMRGPVSADGSGCDLSCGAESRYSSDLGRPYIVHDADCLTVEARRVCGFCVPWICDDGVRHEVEE